MPSHSNVMLPLPAASADLDFPSSHHEMNTNSSRTAVAAAAAARSVVAVAMTDVDKVEVACGVVHRRADHVASATVEEDEAGSVKVASWLIASLCGTHRLRSGHQPYLTSAEDS